ncbi:MAG: hypothetical protein IGR76_10730 [Synechococcales cyanobacterium T60_A2020_003]|nr:hypothetical protein [Synechococcales cyanobacterium T60_A2020_003]
MADASGCHTRFDVDGLFFDRLSQGFLSKLLWMNRAIAPSPASHATGVLRLNVVSRINPFVDRLEE